MLNVEQIHVKICISESRALYKDYYDPKTGRNRLVPGLGHINSQLSKILQHYIIQRYTLNRWNGLHRLNYHQRTK